jgi:pimeloyl-ACP methyl ester carboxylesterase
MTSNFDRSVATGPTMIHANGVDLCIQTFGEATDPALLLINGAAASMDWWEDDFCELIAGGGRFVIRYDHRDTGRSTSYEPGAPEYSVLDLAADAIGILDALGIERAHFAGMSMGGGIAQGIALDHPGRVATLTLISTSPGGPGGPENPDLPPMSETLAVVFSDPAPEPDWTDREAVIVSIIDGERPFAGTIPFNAEGMREIAERVVDRTNDIAASMTNHWILDHGEPVRPRLGDISARTLVLHGTADPLLPYGHGEALAREIPGARLVPLEGGGHQMPPRPLWDVVIPAILEHTAS